MIFDVTKFELTLFSLLFPILDGDVMVNNNVAFLTLSSYNEVIRAAKNSVHESGYLGMSVNNGIFSRSKVFRIIFAMMCSMDQAIYRTHRGSGYSAAA